MSTIFTEKVRHPSNNNWLTLATVEENSNKYSIKFYDGTSPAAIGSPGHPIYLNNGEFQSMTLGIGDIAINNTIVPLIDDYYDIGIAASTFHNLYLKGAIGSSTTPVNNIYASSIGTVTAPIGNIHTDNIYINSFTSNAGLIANWLSVGNLNVDSDGATLQVLSSTSAPQLTVSGPSASLQASGAGANLTISGSNSYLTISGTSPHLTISGNGGNLNIAGESPSITINSENIQNIITVSNATPAASLAKIWIKLIQ